VAEAVGADQTTVSLVELGYRLWGPTFEKLAVHYVEDPERLRRRMLAWCRQVGRSASGTPNAKANRKPRAAA
jgi:hypothetical protein